MVRIALKSVCSPSSFRFVTGISLGVMIWLWPYTHGPVSQFWPNVVAWLCGLLLWLVLLDASPERTNIIVWGWLLTALLSALLGMLQYFDGEGALYPLVAQALPGFAYANTRQINHLASLLNVGLLCVVWLVHSEKLRIAYAVLLGAPIAIALAATASRGGFVQLMLVGGLIYLFGSKSARWAGLRWWICMFGLYLVAAIVLPHWLEFISGVAPERNLANRMDVESTCSSRLVLWRNVLDLIAARPWTGWGWDGLRLGHYMTDLHGERFCSMLTNAHNLPLHLATELGVPLASLLTLGGVFVLLWSRPWAEKDPAAQLGWGVLLVVGFHSMIEYPIWFGNFQTMVLLAIWLVWPPLKARRMQIGCMPEGTQLRRQHLALAGLLTGVLCVMAVDYVRVTQLYLPQADRLESYQTDTLNKVRHSIFFRNWVLFAQVVAATPDKDNATALLDASLEALRISPEPRVIERVIVSASILGKKELVEQHMKLYRAAWPEAYATWQASQRGPQSGSAQ